MKTSNINKLSAVFLILLLGLSSFVMIGRFQDSIRETIEENLRTLRTNYGAEKVYLHLDKPYYVAGETIWLKAYLQDAASLIPSDRSSVVYVDLINVDGDPAKHLVLKTSAGKAAGDIALPDSLPTGKYRLTAYTNWMRNFGEETFFHKEIQIWNRTDTVTNAITHPETAGKMDLQFFPEGGDMVQEIPSRVAFKAIDPQGQGIPVQATIFDQEGRKVVTFKSFHLGMGAFELTPEPGKRYFAKVNFKDGSTVDYPLPEALPQGFTLTIDEVSDPENITAIVRTNVPDPQPLLLTGIAQDRLVYSEAVSWSENEARVKIAKDQFPTGVTRFTLSELTGQPYAERLAFINHNDQLQISIRTDQKVYATREKVTMQIEAKNAQGDPVATDFSLAVTDDELVTPAPNGLGIESYLLLTSDVKGYVEQPGYYFTNSDSEKAQALSYLMMTQGWRRFDWNKLVAGDFPKINFLAENDLAIRGKLLTNKGKPVAKGEVVLYLKDQHETFIVTETNEKGEFAFDGFQFTDSVSLVIQGTDAKGRRDHVEVVVDERSYVPAAPQTPVPGADQLLASTSRDYVAVSEQQIQSVDESQAVTLGDIVLKDIVVESRAKIVEPFRLHNRADVSLRTDQLPVPSSGNILEVLQGRVAGLQVYRTGPNDFRAVIRGQGEPLFLLDGMPIQSSTVGMINPLDIESIDVLKNGASAGIYGGRAAGGVIALYSKRGGTSFEEIDETGKKFIIIHRAAGFTKARQFYSPKYTTKSADDQPDYRTTLYWNPSVQTDASGKAEVTFYTADRNTQYRAILEGVSRDGNVGRKEYTFGTEEKTTARSKTIK